MTDAIMQINESFSEKMILKRFLVIIILHRFSVYEKAREFKLKIRKLVRDEIDCMSDYLLEYV